MALKRYTIEFKKQSIELAKRLGSVTQAAKQLGIPATNVYSWQQQYSDHGKDNKEDYNRKLALEEEIKKLKKEITDLKYTNEVLKKAAGFFCLDQTKKNSS